MSHGHQGPSALGTISRSEAHGLFERLTIPHLSIVANPSLVATNLTTLRRCTHVENVESVMGMKYSTLCLATAAENAIVVSDGKSTRKRTHPFVLPIWQSPGQVVYSE